MDHTQIRRMAIANPDTEYWLPIHHSIPEIAPWYEISSHGKVRSIPWKIIKSNGSYQMIRSRLLSQKTDRYGYKTLGYSNGKTGKENKHIFITVHRVVMLVFRPVDDVTLTVNHINHIRTDNRLCNLEWVTIQDNIKHSHINGRRKMEWKLLTEKTRFLRGEKSPHHKYSEDQIKKVIELSKLSSYSQKQISELTGVSLRAIQHLRSKKPTWKHLPRD